MKIQVRITISEVGYHIIMNNTKRKIRRSLEVPNSLSNIKYLVLLFQLINFSNSIRILSHKFANFNIL